MLRAFLILMLFTCSEKSFSQGRKTFPQPPKPVLKKELFDLSIDMPTDMSAFKFQLKGSHAGHKYYETAVPTFVYQIDNDLLFEKGSMPVGSEVNPIKFTVYRQSYIFQVVPVGTDPKTVSLADRRWVEGRFLKAVPIKKK